MTNETEVSSQRLGGRILGVLVAGGREGLRIAAAGNHLFANLFGLGLGDQQNVGDFTLFLGGGICPANKNTERKSAEQKRPAGKRIHELHDDLFPLIERPLRSDHTLNGKPGGQAVDIPSRRGLNPGEEKNSKSYFRVNLKLTNRRL